MEATRTLLGSSGTVSTLTPALTPDQLKAMALSPLWATAAVG
ncbi:hypothetical protein [Streptacidiphilus sp. MAP12-20]